MTSVAASQHMLPQQQPSKSQRNLIPATAALADMLLLPLLLLL
jgi:hypothetical protein